MATTRQGRRDVAALEARRFEAARLFARGAGQAAVMRALGVSRQTAHEWYHRWRRGGRQGLKAVGRLGRKPRLDRRQLGRVETALLQGPRRHGFATDLWTLQRPARRARERDEAAIRQWVSRRWPAVKKTPAANGPGSSSRTKAGSRSNPSSGALGPRAGTRPS